MADDVECAVGEVPGVLWRDDPAIDEQTEDSVAQVALGDRDRPEILLPRMLTGQVLDLYDNRDVPLALLVHDDAVG